VCVCVFHNFQYLNGGVKLVMLQLELDPFIKNIKLSHGSFLSKKFDV